MRTIGRNAWVSLAALALAAPVCAQELSREALPIAPPPFAGTIGETPAASTPVRPFRVTAPRGAPNVIVAMTDDTGFAMSSAFGGPVPTPNLERLARAGVRFNRFHTTGICSPSRAALLTGRNHHRAATGFLTDLSVGYPGYDGTFPASEATIAQTLRLNGYSTAMLGKHHNVPPGERTVAGPFDMWPTGLGFDYFYGFIGGDTDQWHPPMYRGTSLLPDNDETEAPLDRMLADDAIDWIHNQQAAARGKPFFIYLAPGSMHAPHQAPADYIARFRGRFDAGWDRQRETIYRRQLAEGIIPRGTVLTPRPAEIPAWASLSPDQKRFAARAMEAAAGQLAFQDAQFGRLLDELERMGILDDTLIIAIQGDNGAGAETGVAGSINEIGKIANGITEDDAWLAANADKLGGPETYNAYPAGWAWAMSTPLRWVKQYASMLGGIRNGMIMAWPDHTAQPGSICSEFGHLVDIAPTVLDAAGLPAPKRVFGVAQQSYDGQSLLSGLAKCEPARARSQYFEINGKVGFYQNGWFLSADDGRTPWEVVPPRGFDAAQPKWTLYDLDSDFSQSRDVAGRYPERLAAMVTAWRAAASANQVYPIEHRFFRPRPADPDARRKSYRYWGSDISVPAADGPDFIGRSFTLDAKFMLDKPDASGALMAMGSWFGGWSLYLDEGRPNFVYALSTRPEDTVRLASPQRVADRDALQVRFVSEGPGKGAEIELRHAGATLARGHIARTFFMAAPNGEMIDTGRDTGVPVTAYKTPGGRLEGRIDNISLDFGD
jgi:arylsulfatase